MTWSTFGRLLALVLLVFAGVAQAQPKERRVALLIGNAAYKSSPLRNPVNDTRAMTRTLKSLGFEVVAVENGTRKAMQQAMRQYRDKLSPDTVGLFYYSGHGMQVKGVNYLIPVNAEIRSEAEVEEEAISLNGLLARLDEAKNPLNIVILDACRDNPFERSFRSGTRGLGQVDAPSGTLIAYATAPGRTAADGEGSNGLYTAALLEAVKQPGLSVEEVFKRVRVTVQAKSGQQQVPWEASSLTGNFYFTGPTTVNVTVQADKEAMLWDSVKDGGAAGLQAYLDQFPAGTFAAVARQRMAVLATRPVPPAAPDNRGARGFDGKWDGVYACEANRSGDPDWQRPLTLDVIDGRATMRRGVAGQPGSWSVDLAFAEDGRMTGQGDGVAAGTAKGRPITIEVGGRIDGESAKASGRHGNRLCTIELTRRPG